MEKIALQHRGTWRMIYCKHLQRQFINLMGGTDLMLNGAINGPLHKSVVINCLPKLYVPSTLNIDLILWHTQLFLLGVSWVFPGCFPGVPELKFLFSFTLLKIPTIFFF